MVLVRAAGDALLRRPLHCVVVIGAGGHVHEEVQDGIVLHEGGIYGDAAAGHGEGKLAAALVREGEGAAPAVGDGEGLQSIALVGLYGNGHRVAPAGGGIAEGEGAVAGLAGADGIAGPSAAAPAAGRGGDVLPHRIGGGALENG